VIVHHGFVLAGHSDPIGRRTGGVVDLGILAVLGFFVLSGLLIARSADRTSTPRFLWHRVLRIMPGFWICLLVVAAGFGPAFWIAEHGSLGGYLTPPEFGPVDYVVSNAALVVGQTRIDGLLSGNPYPYGINGSLWTLPYEFGWYLVAGALAIAGLLRVRVLATVVLIVLVLPQNIHLTQPLAALPGLGFVLLSRFGLAFALGIAVYLWRDRIRLDDRLAAVAVLAGGLSLLTGTFPTIGVAAYGYVLLWAAWRLPLRRFDARRDLSYGLYIYAFPVQQALALAGLSALPTPAYVALSLAGTLPFAWASYRFVEGPALRLKHWTPRWIRPAEPVPPEIPVPVELSG
jgi:peptidoglycan/LPS O-acetylase OafA/YrhL